MDKITRSSSLGSEISHGPSFTKTDLPPFIYENQISILFERRRRRTSLDLSLSEVLRVAPLRIGKGSGFTIGPGSAATESLANITEIHDGLDLSGDDDGGYSFGIFSVKFSTNGRELVAGTSDDSIYVYDLEANKLSLRILAHTSDVNTVCFADESGHLIYSSSDDNFCKVWDRRCLKAKANPVGILMGHVEGITYLDSRGDGRYFISNGKDQTIKLWDIHFKSIVRDLMLGKITDRLGR
ncbi:L14B protein [Sarracenia purpurea var. burkii]